ncbi:MAG: UDP-N-acetyl glucosamine 2-epimerase [Dictyoglomus sp.]|nr:UDP-N-acetyl glucosamine 2-epimerase [Dictyoglomus sp.]MDW8188464.1 UDP-N-acetyl glucosamine 2-epimerase [Dictyoglomus sp.]
MKIVSIVGARPQFIKLAPLSKELRKRGIKDIILHTGQHYDANMNKIFFEELEISEPDYNLGIGSGLHGEQTGKMLIGIEEILLKEKPDLVIVYGDTNSTLAGALASSKLHIPLAHIEAGLRSFNKKMPEEINRIVADHLSDILFCPTETAVENLKREGITEGVYEEISLKPKEYYLITIHRAENTDDSKRLRSILSVLSKLDKYVVFPIHPRTRNKIKEYGLENYLNFDNIRAIEPLGYLDMLKLEREAYAILTDSGGVQKEAFWLKVPCITLREETEWIETVKYGWNTLVGTEEERILNALKNIKYGEDVNFDKDYTAPKIIEIITSFSKGDLN